jgi:hypothetical protein
MTRPGELRGRRHRARRAGTVFGRAPDGGCGSVVATGRRRRLRRDCRPPSGGVRTQGAFDGDRFRTRAAANRSRAGRVDRSISLAAGGARFRVCVAGSGAGGGTPDRPVIGEHGTSPNARTGKSVMRTFVSVRGTWVENRRRTFGNAGGRRHAIGGPVQTVARSTIPGAASGLVQD